MIEGRRICVVVHYEGMSGAVRSLPLRLGTLASENSVEFLVPAPGAAQRSLSGLGEVSDDIGFSALTFPESLGAMPRHLAGMLAQVRRFRRHLRHTQPDLVIVTSMMVPAAVWAARREGIRVLVHSSELLNAERLPSAGKRAVARVLLDRTARWADRVVACSDAVAAQFEGSGARVETLYPPIAEATETGDREGFRRRHGIASSEVCVAMVGNVTRGRGQDVLLRAVPLLRARVPGVRCLIVGEPFDRGRDLEYRQRLGNLAEELGLADAVDFLGMVERVDDVYAAADVVVNPARIPESFGRTACEALVAGRPAVASRVGAVPEILHHGRTALLVEPEDPAALAAALVEVIGDRALADRLVAAGREEVQARFAPAHIATRFSRIVAETLAGEEARLPLVEPPAPVAPGSPAAEVPASQRL